MSSRKEQKEQARLEREAKQAELQAKAARDRRLKVIGGVIGLAVIAAFVAIVISTSGSGDEAPPEAKNEVIERFAGIPQEGVTVGEPDAKATIVEFADLKCPFCADFAVESLPTVVDELVRSGKAKLVFKNLTFLDQVTPGEADSTNAAQFAQAVGLQNKLWEFVDLWYLQQKPENQVYATESYLKSIANQIPGVDADKAWNDRSNPAVQEELAAADELFNSLGLSGTPAFAVGADLDSLEVVTVSDLADPQPLIDAVDALQ